MSIAPSATPAGVAPTWTTGSTEVFKTGTWRASLARPDVRTRLPGLYLAGGEVHPGAGVPMATLSGRLAAATALADAP